MRAWHQGNPAVTANRIAKWDGTNWSSLGNGLNSSVTAIAIDSNNNIYVGGSFTQANAVVGNPAVTANRIAKWDGTNWSALGNGLNGSVTVTAIAIDSNNNIYVGGSFTQANAVGGNHAVNINYIAKWDGTNWSSLGNGLNGSVIAIAIDSNNNIYVGGSFTQANAVVGNPAVTANRIAKWDGTNWSALNGGASSTVNAIAIDSNNNIYVGGSFTYLYNGNNIDKQNSPLYAFCIGKWNGTNWTPLKGGVSSTVNTLAIGTRSSKLLIGGSYSTIYNNSTFASPVIVNNISSSSLLNTTPWNISLYVNNKFLYSMNPNTIINANVTDTNNVYTNGPVV